MKQCSVEGCNRKHYAKGLCNNHYNQGRRNREFGINLNDCCVEGCKEAAVTNKMCTLHYQRVRNNVKLDLKHEHRIKNKGKTCLIKGCSKPAKKRGFCRSCYIKQKREGNIEFLNICIVKGCGKYVEGRGLCRSHYRQEVYAKKNNITNYELTAQKILIKDTNCVFPECNSKANSKNLCAKHYDRFRYHRKQNGIETVQEYIENRDRLTRKYKN